MATHFSFPAWEIQWRDKPGKLQSMWSQELDITEWLNNNIYAYIYVCIYIRVCVCVCVCMYGDCWLKSKEVLHYIQCVTVDCSCSEQSHGYCGVACDLLSESHFKWQWFRAFLDYISHLTMSPSPLSLPPLKKNVPFLSSGEKSFQQWLFLL